MPLIAISLIRGVFGGEKILKSLTSSFYWKSLRKVLKPHGVNQRFECSFDSLAPLLRKSAGCGLMCLILAEVRARNCQLGKKWHARDPDNADFQEFFKCVHFSSVPNVLKKI